MENLFRKIISYLIYKKNCKWLENIINTLCLVEIHTSCTIERKLLQNIEKIPKGFYCYSFHNTCPYWDYSHIARFCYGEHSAGYCHYLREGDFNSNTLLLWDQCKCCDINEDDDEGETVECSLEL